VKFRRCDWDELFSGRRAWLAWLVLGTFILGCLALNIAINWPLLRVSLAYWGLIGRDT
jgi:hypothetical protein